MAIERVNKVNLIVPRSESENLLLRLQRDGFFHLEQVSLELESDEPTQEHALEEETETAIREELSQVHFCLRFLGSFLLPKGFIQSFFKPRLQTTRRRIESMEKKKLFYLYDELERIDRRLVEIARRLEEIDQMVSILKPWVSFPLPLNGKVSDKVNFYLTSLSKNTLERLLEALKEEELVQVELVSEEGKKVQVAVFFYFQAEEKVEKVFSSLELEKIDFKSDLNASQLTKKLLAEKKQLIQEQRKLKNKVKKYLKFQELLRLREGYLKARLAKVQARGKLVTTERVSFIEGWIKEADSKKLAKVLNSTLSAYELTLTEPLPTDNPPVILKNRPFFKPFEILVELYGLPNYWEIDPTPYLAFTFLLFFGLAVGDAGYAILLYLSILFLRWKLPFSAKSREFLKIFTYGAVPSFIIGALTGSWFGLPIASLPPLLRKMMVLNPLEGSGPVIFLVFTLIIGFLHLISGLILEAIDNLRKGNWQSALLDQLGTIIFLIGAFLYVIIFFQSISGKIPSWSPIAKALLLAGAAVIVIFANRESKSWLGRIGGGLYSLYGMSGYLGDTISYSRLMALGLATVLIGFSFNLMIQPLWSFGWLGAIVALPVFLALHLINLAINLIGAFVHPLRLHYVELFKQFYEDGGRKFEPLTLESEGVLLKK